MSTIVSDINDYVQFNKKGSSSNKIVKEHTNTLAALDVIDYVNMSPAWLIWNIAWIKSYSVLY